ncbi:carboxylating nicotinate-nucleotide diphosphorylase [Gloeocapsopsis sp. IPPAS B-1203]|uniref:carboxylating nicotinate-nucleotide diphosphorylase n=1 Tax=Gloeocapsopsis sp. IPPAS B-1203 TaxID=2049454 RepID=UPI000C17B91D|nr:carboxylating nicotinate-nucleotide diphosphorylase [Gloeocapsopsis sp. IPPAS B-1203]PIG91974.1 nicotinate-nucleotide diphosphorylase (carboxylating) [Gloeocapsopsis sp. IPPAS B-1203]
MKNFALPPLLILDPMLSDWLMEDIGRGDRTTQGLLSDENSWVAAQWIVKAPGVIAGLPVASRVFQLLNEKTNFITTIDEGQLCQPGQVIAQIEGPLDAMLTGERVALNLAMHLSGIATLTRKYVEKLAELPTQLVDTRKTTPGLRLLEKYATQIGGARNHRMGLDDAVMIKDNHIAAAGGIRNAIARVRTQIPYPLTIEVETETIEQVQEAVQHQADIIMLDNMPVEVMRQAVKLIRQYDPRIKIEASGNITLETIYQVGATGVDYVSTSAPVTQSSWLDLSMKIKS